MMLTFVFFVLLLTFNLAHNKMSPVCAAHYDAHQTPSTYTVTCQVNVDVVTSIYM